MSEVIYHGHWPIEVFSVVQPIVESLKGAFPSWLKCMYVIWGDDGESSMADISPNEPHGHATMRIYSPFLTAIDHDRDGTIAHEIAHLYFARVDQAVETIVGATIKEGSAARTMADALYETAVEAATEELGRTLVRARI